MSNQTNTLLYAGDLAYTWDSLAEAQARGELIIWRNGENQFPLPPTISIGHPISTPQAGKDAPRHIQLTCSFRPPYEGCIEWARFHAHLESDSHTFHICDLWPRQTTHTREKNTFPLTQIRELLLRCPTFLEPTNLNALFVDSGIQMWQHQLPQSHIKQEQANQLIHFLMPLQNDNGRSALVLFLEALQRQFSEQDGRYHQIQQILQQLTHPNPHKENKNVDVIASGLQEEIATWTLCPHTPTGIQGSWQFGLLTTPFATQATVCLTLFIEARVVTKGTFLWANTEQISHQLQVKSL